MSSFPAQEYAAATVKGPARALRRDEVRALVAEAFDAGRRAEVAGRTSTSTYPSGPTRAGLERDLDDPLRSTRLEAERDEHGR